MVRDRQFFKHFDIETRFVPQRRALFQRLSFLGCFAQCSLKCASRHSRVHFFNMWISKSAPTLTCFWNFDLQIILLRATTACNFSCFISKDGSAPAALANLLFDQPLPQNIGKTQCSATFLPFCAPASSFFWLFLFSNLLSSFSSLTLPTSVASSAHTVRSLTSKFPWINAYGTG